MRLASRCPIPRPPPQKASLPARGGKPSRTPKPSYKCPQTTTGRMPPTTVWMKLEPSWSPQRPIRKQSSFTISESLEALCGGLLKYTDKHNWSLHAWAVFTNHYHFIAKSPPDDAGESQKISHRVPQPIASQDGSMSATALREEKSEHNYARNKAHLRSQLLRAIEIRPSESSETCVLWKPLRRIHRGAAPHRFEKTATSATKQTVASFKTDALKIEDDF